VAARAARERSYQTSLAMLRVLGSVVKVFTGRREQNGGPKAENKKNNKLATYPGARTVSKTLKKPKTGETERGDTWGMREKILESSAS